MYLYFLAFILAIENTSTFSLLCIQSEYMSNIILCSSELKKLLLLCLIHFLRHALDSMK